MNKPAGRGVVTRANAGVSEEDGGKTGRKGGRYGGLMGEDWSGIINIQ